MKVLAASDFHGSNELLQNFLKEANNGEYDLVVLPGDFESPERYKKIVDSLEPTVIASTGNWDFNFKPPKNDDYDSLFNYMKITYDDYKICVIGSVFPDDFKKDIRDWAEGHDNNKLFFVSHYPPKRLGDRAVTGVRAGLDGFRKLILKLKPAAWFCGHIHEAFGHYSLMNTDVFNCSIPESKKCFSVEFGEDGVESFEEVDLSES